MATAACRTECRHGQGYCGANGGYSDAYSSEFVLSNPVTARTIKEPTSKTWGAKIFTCEWWSLPKAWAFPIRLSIHWYKEERGDEWATCSLLTSDGWKLEGCENIVDGWKPEGCSKAADGWQPEDYKNAVDEWKLDGCRDSTDGCQPEGWSRTLPHINLCWNQRADWKYTNWL